MQRKDGMGVTDLKWQFETGPSFFLFSAAARQIDLCCLGRGLDNDRNLEGVRGPGRGYYKIARRAYKKRRREQREQARHKRAEHKTHDRPEIGGEAIGPWTDRMEVVSVEQFAPKISTAQCAWKVQTNFWHDFSPPAVIKNSEYVGFGTYSLENH